MVVLNQVTPITFPDLDNATTLTGNEYVAISQLNASAKSTISMLPQGMSAGVVTFGTSGGSPFPNYRTLKAGEGIELTDSGAQSDLTISLAAGGSAAPATASYVVMGASAVLDHERILAVDSTMSLSDGGPNGNVTLGVSNAPAASLTGTTLAANVVFSSLTSLGTILSGAWNGTLISGTYGGTGVNNGASTITVGGNVTFSGAHTFNATITGNTSVTFPTSGTLSTSTGTVTSVTFTGDGTVLSSTPSSAVTTTGTLTAALANAGAKTVLGNTTSGSAAPSYTSSPVVSGSSTADRFISTVATGTAPLTVSSTTQVANLNAATAGTATTATTATNATNTAITDDTTTNATMNLTWVTSNSGNLPQKVTSTKLTFNPSTGVLSSTSFTGAGTGLTGTAASLTAGSVTTNANLTGDVTSVGNATTLTNAPVIAKVLTGYTSGAGTVSATDSILQAIQKLNGNDATNANLTGPITSVGNATAIASQTGTGTKFVVDNGPTLIAPVLGAASATSITFSSTTGVVGTTTNNNAAAGSVGEYVSTDTTSPVSLTTATTANIANISLTAGDWDVWINGVFSGNSATVVNYMVCSISSTSATIDSGNGKRTDVSGFASAIFATDGTISNNVGPFRLALSGTTTIYFVAQAGFSVNTCSCAGIIQARRRR